MEKALYVSSHVRGQLLKIMILSLGLAGLLQEGRAQGYFDFKIFMTPSGNSPGGSQSFPLSPPPLLPHLSADSFLDGKQTGPY